MKQEFVEQAVRGAPAVAGAAYAGVTLNTWVMVATLIYIIIQGAYLLRKWWREEKEAKAFKAKLAEPEVTSA